MITLPQAMGRVILNQVLGQRNKYPPEVIKAAEYALERLHYWDMSRNLANTGPWHINSESWREFKREMEIHNIDLPALLDEDR